MTATTGTQPDVLVSAIPDLCDVPLGAEIAIGGAGYTAIMRDSVIGAPATAVSRFNSSI